MNKLHHNMHTQKVKALKMQAQAGAEGAQATGNAGDDVVDGEFTEK